MSKITITSRVKTIMNANVDLPMHETCGLIVEEFKNDEKPIPMSYARAWYIDFVKRNLAAGAIAPAPKTPRAKKTPVVRVAVPVEGLEVHGETVDSDKVGSNEDLAALLS